MTITGLHYRLLAHEGNLSLAKDDVLLDPHYEALPVCWIRWIAEIDQPIQPFSTTNQTIAGVERLRRLVDQKCGKYIQTDISIVSRSNSTLELLVRWSPRNSTASFSQSVVINL